MRFGEGKAGKQRGSSQEHIRVTGKGPEQVASPGRIEKGYNLKEPAQLGNRLLHTSPGRQSEYSSIHSGEGQENPGEGSAETRTPQATIESVLSGISGLTPGEYDKIGEAVGLTPGTRIQEGVTLEHLGPGRPRDSSGPALVRTGRPYIDDKNIVPGSRTNPLYLRPQNPQLNTVTTRLRERVAVAKNAAFRRNGEGEHDELSTAQAALDRAEWQAQLINELTNDLRTAQEHPKSDMFRSLAARTRQRLNNSSLRNEHGQW